jgi:hypothetical protein
LLVAASAITLGFYLLAQPGDITNPGAPIVALIVLIIPGLLLVLTIVTPRSMRWFPPTNRWSRSAVMKNSVWLGVGVALVGLGVVLAFGQTLIWTAYLWPLGLTALTIGFATGSPRNWPWVVGCLVLIAIGAVLWWTVGLAWLLGPFLIAVGLVRAFKRRRDRSAPVSITRPTADGPGP